MVIGKFLDICISQIPLTFIDSSFLQVLSYYLFEIPKHKSHMNQILSITMTI